MMYLGIDVAKRKFECAILMDERFRSKTFDNDVQGVQTCLKWIQRWTDQPVHACLEATGSYGERLAEALFDAGHRVSMVNPGKVRAFAQGLGMRNKTDQVDARALALFAQKAAPELWIAPLPAVRDLSALVRRLDAVVEMHTQETNRLQVAHHSTTADIDEHVQFLDARIGELQRSIREHIDKHPDLRAQRDLLISIPGVGEATSAWLIAELSTKRFACAREAAACAGLTPIHRQSGDSVRGKPHLPRARGRLRKALYWPAICAIRHNPAVRAHALRLKARGKHNMVVIAAAMRKLLHIAFGVLKSGVPFDPKLTGA